LNEKIFKEIKNYQPNIIYTHLDADNHFDHKIVNNAVIISCRAQNNLKIQGLYGIEIPSASEFTFNDLSSNLNHYVDVTNYIKKKIDLCKLYHKEMLRYPNFRSYKGIENLSKYRGNLISIKNAEAFKIIRQIKY